MNEIEAVNINDEHKTISDDIVKEDLDTAIELDDLPV